MEDEELDTHICLVCHTTVIGLDNYVRHKKKECTGRKTEASHDLRAKGEQSNVVTSTETTVLSPSKDQTFVSPKSGVESIPVSSTIMSPGTSRAIESNIMMYGDASPKDISITDFLSSLELQCRDTTTEQAKPDKESHTEEKSPAREDRLDDHKSLRIASILNDLAFSDDEDDNEDDLPNIDTENLISLVEEDDHHHPPRSHTGGKWRPGTAPPAGGKWKPSSKLLAMSKHRQSQHKTSIGKRMPGESTEKKEEDRSMIAENDREKPDQDEEEHRDEQTTLTVEKSTDYSCRVCNRTFKNEVGLNRHLLTNYHMKRNQRDVEEIPTKRTKTETVAAEETVVLECPTCDKQFNSKYNFARHLVSSYHQKRSGKDTRQFLLNENMQTVLLRQNPYQCRVCNFYCMEHQVFMEHLEHKSHKHKVTWLIGPLLCQLCKFYTRKSEQMVEHFKKISHNVKRGERPCIVKEKRHQIKCPQCELDVHSAAALKRHLKFTHGGKGKGIIRSEKGVRVRPNCPYCDLQCASTSALALHVRRIHIREKKFKCDTCKRSFSDKHTLSLHNQSKYHYRRAADAVGVSLMEFLENAKEDDSQKMSAAAVLNDLTKKNQKRKSDCVNEDFNCKTCGMTFSSMHNLKIHIKSKRHKLMMKTTESGNVVQCPTCSQKFDSTNSYVTHEMKEHINIGNTEDGKPVKHTGIDDKYMDFIKEIEKNKKTMVECPECNKKINSGNIYVHLRKHTNSKPFRCKLCNLKFSDHNLLKHHVLCVHMQVKNFTCEQCGKGYSRSSHYHRHIRDAHTNPENVQQFPCKTCGKVFKDMNRVHQHERTVHSTKANVCPWKGCHRKFSTPYPLKIHMRTHTGEKPFLCQLCGFSCPDVSGMARHKRTHRAREYPCDYCTYKGTTRAHLKRHLRIHIGSKPYKCLHCDYRCNNVENLRKHIINNKVHAGKFMYPCKHCSYGTHSAKDMQKHLMFSHSVSLDNDKHVGMYLGTYEKSEDPDELPEGSYAIPLSEKKRTLKQSISTSEELMDLVSSEPIVTVIIKTNDGKQDEEILANLEIPNVEVVTDLFKVVESAKIDHTIVSTNSEVYSGETSVVFVKSPVKDKGQDQEMS